MRIHLVCKRFYTNRDLLRDRFGRLFHLPVVLARRGSEVHVDAIDYKNSRGEHLRIKGVPFRSLPAAGARILGLPLVLQRHAVDSIPDVIMASGDSHIGYMGLHLARKLDIPFVFDVYDYYPAFSGNLIPGMKWMFRRAVAGADLVLCASTSLMHRLQSINARRLLVENGVDPALFVPEDMARARRELGLPYATPIIGYFGSIDQDRGPLLVAACRVLRSQYPTLRLLFAGRVTKVDLPHSWITYWGVMPQEELPRLMNACDVLAIPYADTLFNDMCGACKIAEYLSCGKPVVATRVSCHAHIFRDAPHSLCEPTVSSMASALKRQLTSPQVVPFPEQLRWEKIGAVLDESLRALPRPSAMSSVR